MIKGSFSLILRSELRKFKALFVTPQIFEVVMPSSYNFKAKKLTESASSKQDRTNGPLRAHPPSFKDIVQTFYVPLSYRCRSEAQGPCQSSQALLFWDNELHQGHMARNRKRKILSRQESTLCNGSQFVSRQGDSCKAVCHKFYFILWTFMQPLPLRHIYKLLSFLEHVLYVTGMRKDLHFSYYQLLYVDFSVSFSYDPAPIIP